MNRQLKRMQFKLKWVIQLPQQRHVTTQTATEVSYLEIKCKKLTQKGKASCI